MADANDLAELEVLTDDILCQCLQERHQLDKIYTYVGDILIAVNPFCELGLYTNEVSAQYCNVHNKSELPPHLFAIGDAAYGAMRRTGKSQVCVISGESGAGKTESAKQFIRQIMDVSARGIMGGGSMEEEAAEEKVHVRARHPVEGKIMQQNPILEAFGNAQTVMNDNSSRFGKFIDLKFNEQGLVVGAQMSHYLLEKARIVMQGPGERNYHIFSMLFAGFDQTLLDMYGLTSYENYNYLPDGPGDVPRLKEEYHEMVQAFADCGFSESERDNMFSMLAGVLHLGNLDFQEGDQGDAGEVANPDTLDTISRVLMIDQDELGKALMTAVLNMRGEIIIKKNNVDKCRNARNATAKAMYDRIFQWLVFKVNITLAPDSTAGSDLMMDTIGILDIFGFENFKVNGFDQMCINLANEQLHYFFNQHIFAAEMGSYASEGLEMSGDVLFHDNKQVLDLFFAKPMGVLALLDEECNFPKASASSLLNKLDKNLAERELYQHVKGGYAFGVVHFAGEIKYHADGFLEKNVDPLPDNMKPAMRSSRNDLIRMLFTDGWAVLPDRSASGAGGGGIDRSKSRMGGLFKSKRQSKRSMRGKSTRGGKSVRKDKTLSKQKSKMALQLGAELGGGGKKDKKEVTTVSAQFKVSLASLMMKMGMCDPHFVRCIKPNPQKKPHLWDQELVLRQLTYTGMLQTVKMRREGFPFRIPFAEFFQSYYGLVYPFHMPQPGTKQSCFDMLTALEEKIEAERAEKGLTTITTKLSGWQCAKSMVFLKYWQLDLLDGRLYPFKVAALKIQTMYRGHMARKRFGPLKQKYKDECAAAATFVAEIFRGGDRINNNLEVLIEEEERRGTEGLGIKAKVDLKAIEKAKKKAEKEAAAIAKNPEKAAKKFDAELQKVKKGVVRWWLKFERNKGNHVDENGSVFPWFHGLISRTEAEDYLFDQPSGAFLIRVSERVHGYALSFRHNSRIRHYKLGFSPTGGYEVVGNSASFPSLVELVTYFSDSPVTPGSDDFLSEPVQFEHDLGLGIGNADDMKGKAAPPRMTREERAAKTKTGLNFLDNESSGPPLDLSIFLKSPEDAADLWLRGKIDRIEAEAELKDRGLVDGRFLVREKLRTSERAVFALSLTYRGKFYHHLLSRQREGDWHLDERPVDYSDELEEVIAWLQKRKSPRLACVLESNAPAAPEGVATKMGAGGGGGPRRASAGLGKPAPRTLVPSPSSSVDEVVAWLASLGLAKYAGVFYKAKLDGKKLHDANEKKLRKLIKNSDDYTLAVRALR